MISEEEFKKTIKNNAGFLLLLGITSSLICIFITLYQLISGENNDTIQYLVPATLILSVVNYLLYLIYNKYRKNKLTIELYDGYKKNGFINREYTKNNKNKYLILIKDVNNKITQKNYDFIWEQFLEYSEKNSDNLNNMVKSILLSKKVSSLDFEKYIKEFRKSLEKNKYYKKNFSSRSALRIYPVFNNYQQNKDIFIKTIMYSQDKIIYFKEKIPK